MPTYHIWRYNVDTGNMDKIGDFVEGTRAEAATRARETELGTDPTSGGNDARIAVIRLLLVPG